MSNWVDNAVIEAFSVYRRYLAMGLHFRSGSAYDYGLYGGKTNVTLASFKKKPKDEIRKFMGLNTRLKAEAINPDEFLFANARYGQHHSIEQLISKDAFWIYSNWNEHFGTPEKFDESIKKLILQAKADFTGFQTKEQVTMFFLDQPDHKWLEVIAWILQKNPEIITSVKVACEESAMHKLVLERAIKVQKLYSFLCII